ncbi:MAG: homoserine kinase [Phycisphaerales bacterium]
MRTTASAFAPCTAANLGPGYDLVGLALDGPGDRVTVTVEPAPEPSATLERISGAAGIDELPPATDDNSVVVAALETLRAAKVGARARVTLHKGLPVGSGLGSSAASAAASAYATNLAIGAPLRKAQLIMPCVEAEARMSGRHADNVAPALLGGLVLVRSLVPIDAIRLPVPEGLRIAIVRPRLKVLTKEARAAVPRSVPVDDAIAQAANLASFVAACHTGDLDLLGRCLEDRIGEPARIPLITGAADAIHAMRDEGPLGCGVSGSGPTLFAICRSHESAETCALAAIRALRENSVEATYFISRADAPGVREV